MKELENKFVEVLNYPHGQKLKLLLEKYFGNATNFAFSRTKEDGQIARFYGAVNGRVCFKEKREVLEQNFEIVTLEELQNLEKYKKLPRLVRVWDDDRKHSYKRVAIFENNKGVICLCGDQKLSDVDESDTGGIFWRYYEEIEPDVELTKQEIADKFGINIENLKIV